MTSKTLRLAVVLATLSLALPMAFAGGGGMGGGPGGGMGGMGGPGGMGGGMGGPGGMGGGAGGMGGGMGGMGGGMGGGGYTRMSTIDMIKQQLAVPDNEWTVIQPKLQKVLDAQNALRATNNMYGMGGMGGPGGGMGGGGMGGGGRGGRGGRGGMTDFGGMDTTGTTTAPATQSSPLQTAQTELNNALLDTATKPDILAAKLKALRDARTKATETLHKAQEELRNILTLRQEATLVNMGYLE